MSCDHVHKVHLVNNAQRHGMAAGVSNCFACSRMVLAAEMWANQSAMKFVLGVLNHVDSQTSECPDTRREVARNMATRFHAGCKLDPAVLRESVWHNDFNFGTAPDW
jgi:hypothetical protein